MSVILMNNKNGVGQVTVLLIIFIAMAVYDIAYYKKGRRLRPVGILLLAFGVFWVRFGANWAFLANLILWALYTISKRKMAIVVTDKEVLYPSFPKKRLQWSDLNNVILKDDLLTIDCKNNKVYQHLIKDSEQYAEEREFNDFCGNLINK